jgi:hypothetical protein
MLSFESGDYFVLALLQGDPDVFASRGPQIVDLIKDTVS